MADTARRALLCGGTGLVGREVLAQLGDDSRYASVISLVRRNAASHGTVESRHVSFDDLDTLVLPPIDDAFCALGTTRKQAGSVEAFRRVDFDYVVAFARAAKRAGAKRFAMISSLGATPQSGALYLRVKGDAERAVRGLDFETVGIVRPSLLVGQRETSRPGEAVALAVSRLMRPVMLGRFKRYLPISARTVASGLIRLAWTGHPGVTVLESDEIASAER